MKTKRLILALVFAFGLVALPTTVLTTTSCGSATAIQTEYRTLGSVVELRDLAMKGWASYYVSLTPPGAPVPVGLEDKATKVRAADEKYRAAMKVFHGAVTVAYSDKTTTPPEVAAAASALVDLVRSFGVKI